MPEISLAAETTRVTGSRSSRRLRASGHVPAVLYGHGIDPVSLSIEGRALRTALTGDAGTHAVVSLTFDGRNELAVTKTIQRDPTRNRVLHVDFQVVRRDEIISVEVPIILVGEADEVRKGDGIISHELHALVVESTPGNIPNQIEVDISGLNVGESIRVGDIALGAGASTTVDPDIVVVLAQGPQAVEGVEGEGAEGEGAEAAPEGESAPESE